jgi:hypothetical protein
MNLKMFLCQMCGHKFEVECVDRNDRRYLHLMPSPVTCPKCRRPRVEEIQSRSRVMARGWSSV